MRRLITALLAAAVCLGFVGNAVSEAAPDRMALGVNAPMYGGWTTENGMIRANGTFDPDYVRDMRPFGVVRYMEIARINGSRIRTVSDMEDQDDWQGVAGDGIPVSEIARHARRLGVQPWVCVPHMANDALVRHMARRLRGLRPIVEYSNELANTQFEQSRWAAAQIGPYSGSTQQREYALRYASERTRRIAQIWREIDPEVTIVYTDAPTRALMRQSRADVLGTAGYLGIESGWSMYSYVRGYSVDQLLNWLRGPATDRLIVKVRDSWRGKRRWPLYLYEAGQHVRGDVVASSIAAQRDPGMEAVYRRMLRRLDGIGVSLFMHYTGARKYEGFSTFGMIEYTGQPKTETPKWRALRMWSCPEGPCS
jgi:hypothetical protein